MTFCFIIANSNSKALGSGTSGSAVCISACLTSLAPCIYNTAWHVIGEVCVVFFIFVLFPPVRSILERPYCLVAVRTAVKRQTGKSESVPDAASPASSYNQSIFQFLLNSGTARTVEICKKAMYSEES